MKQLRRFILLIVGMLCLPAITNAQIEVHDNGKVSIGGNPASRPPCEAYVQGSAFGFGLCVEHLNTNTWSYGISTNLINDSNTSYNLTVGSSSTPIFYVSGKGWIYCNGVYYTSDSSLKKDIVKIPSALAKINKLSGYTYHFKQTKLDKGPDSGKQFVPDTAMHMGVMAQEVEKVAPYMVKEVRNGKKAVDYLQLIPLLLQGTKELNDKINQQADELALLKSRYDKLNLSLDSANNLTGVGKTSSPTAEYILGQNAPNPFNTETRISYQLKANYSSAVIYVFDLQGSFKKSYTLTSPDGSITIKASELNAGMYLYSLVVDGKEIAEKKMLLTN